MARNRQRAKERQQQRREERLRESGQTPPEQGADGAAAGDGADAGDGKADRGDPAEVGRVAGETGAPPENLGRSDASLEADANTPRDLSEEEEEELFLEDEDFEVDQDELAEAEAAESGGTAVATGGPKGKRGDRAPATGEPVQAKGLARVIAFLRACWAELQRVQWPDRRQTTQLTAIVLVFIVIMGGYLGLLDAIISRVVQEIL